MTVSTSIPSIVATPTGLVVPDEDAILVGAQADLNLAFGGNLNPSLDTPQGQLASSLTAVVADANAKFLALANGVDPSYASGRLQDGIARIYFLTRIPAQPTVVNVLCVGGIRTVIPVGFALKNDDGNIYTCTTSGTITALGNITLPFACSVSGPVACPAGTMNTIIRSLGGLDQVLNVSDGVIGRLVETRADFEARRAQSVAKNSVGSLQSIQGNILGVTNVLDCYVTENASNSPLVLPGVTLPPFNIYVAVAGGNDLAIATAIWKKKLPGGPMYGNTTVVVTDNSQGYVDPLPTYPITFNRPTLLSMYFNVVIANSSIVPSDAQIQIQSAIVKAFAGGDGQQRVRIAGGVFTSRFYACTAALGPWATIIDMFIGSVNMPAAVVTASVTGNVMTVTGITSGAISLGQFVDAIGITRGTKIQSLGTGTGGTGTYILSTAASPAVSSGTIRMVTPSLSAIRTQINQLAVIAPDQIAVNFL